MFKKIIVNSVVLSLVFSAFSWFWQPTANNAATNCCAYTITPEPTNPTTISKSPVELKYAIVNQSKCTSQEGLINFIFSIENSGLSFKVPMPPPLKRKSCTLNPGSTLLLELVFDPPTNAKEGELITRYLIIKATDKNGKECGSKKYPVTLKYSTKPVCCDYFFKPVSIPGEVFEDEAFEAKYEIVNRCKDSDLTLNINIKNDPKIESVSPSGLIKVNSSKSMQIVLKMKVPDYTRPPKPPRKKATFAFVVTPVSSQECRPQTVRFEVRIKKRTDKCCDFSFSCKGTPMGDPVIEICKGALFHLGLELKNNCQTPITVNLTSDANSNFNGMSTSNIVLQPNSAPTTIPTFSTMPQNCTSNEEVVFKFNVTTDCGETKILEVPIKCKDCSQTCNTPIVIEQRLANPDVTIEICKGQSGSYGVYWKNNSTVKVKIRITQLSAPAGGMIYASPSTFSLNPNTEQLITYNVKMPEDCVPGVVAYSTKTEAWRDIWTGTPETDPCYATQEVESPQILCKECNNQECCELQITKKYDVPPETGAISICPGEVRDFVFEVKNICQEKNILVTPSGMTNGILSISPTGAFTLGGSGSATSTKNITVKFKMPECNPETTEPIKMIVKLTTDCGVEYFLEQSIICKYCPKCCDLKVALKGRMPEMATNLCPGQKLEIGYTITNLCPDQSISATLVSENGNPAFASSQLTIPAGSTKDFVALFTMPECRPGVAVKMSFVVRACNKEYKVEQTFTCKDCQTCCDWTARIQPELRVSQLRLCPGEVATLNVYELFNNCPKGSNAITFTKIYSLIDNLTVLSPSTPFVLQPQERKPLSLKIQMPKTCKPETEQVFAFTVETKECGKKEFLIKAICKNCEKCCDFGIKLKTRIIDGFAMCAGEKAVFTYSITNNCPSDAIEITLSSTGTPSFEISKLTIPAGSTIDVNAYFTMPRCSPGQAYTMSFVVAGCGKELRQTLQIMCKSCEAQTCCDYEIPYLQGPTQMCPGEEFSYTPTIKNTKCKSELTVTISPGNSNMKINGQTTGYTVTIPSGGSVSFTVSFKMPQCKAGEKSEFAWLVKPKNCTENKYAVQVSCKDCSTKPCENSIKLKITKVQTLEGMVTIYGDTIGSRNPVSMTITFKDTSSKPSSMQVGKCYEICYKVVSSGRTTYNEGTSWKEVSCVLSNNPVFTVRSWIIVCGLF